METEIALHCVRREADGEITRDHSFAPKIGSPIDSMWRQQPKLVKTISVYQDGHSVEHFREDRG